ncbi:hypothetical protein BCS42_04690 [Crenothrix sp. D3]|jgi:hypothetical protein|nr:hypothetical protein BCS42_04690 [Crenothrix sp. D3]
MDKNNHPLKVALHGMEERTSKTMVMYLQGPCRGAAMVVNDNDADIDVFDADVVGIGSLMAEHRVKKPYRPVIALSLRDGELGYVLYVKKPVKTDDMLAALDKAGVLIKQNEHNTAQSIVEKSDNVSLKTFVLDNDERKKTAKHEAAMQLNEKGFNAFIGNVAGLDVNDPAQLGNANYDPKNYFQSHVESAFKISRELGDIMQLNSGWSPVIIFPKDNEVWLDADDKQLRAFSGLVIAHTLNEKISTTPLTFESSSVSRSLEKFYTMDAFLWKVACWASKGRYPNHIDITQPVYLKSWPNFTRLLITPHALRISALLIKEPRTLANVAEVLNIKPQYVFVFISAACALGLTGQARRVADVLIAPSTEIKENKNKGFLSRVMSKLRG